MKTDIENWKRYEPSARRMSRFRPKCSPPSPSAADLKAKQRTWKREATGIRSDAPLHTRVSTSGNRHFELVNPVNNQTQHHVKPIT